MKRIKMYCLIIALLGYITTGAQPPGTKLYYGLLHSHTLFSDGSGTPEEAYKAAKVAGLDFFCITEHNHNKAEQGADADRKDGILIANNHDLYNSTAIIPLSVTLEGHTQQLNVKSVKKAATDATTNTFLALYGQEFSTISSGNHMNVINANDVIDLPSGNFKALYDWVKATNDNSILLQMNHPDVHGDLFGRDADKNDYGIDESAIGSSFGDFVNYADKYVELIELLSGPAMSKTANQPYHYPHVHEDDYFFYLKQGLHLTPSAGQDNHYKTWGTSSNARVGVYATALTKEAIADAIRNYHTFATEDKNLSLSFSINHSFMGSSITVAADQALQFEVKVNDTDEASRVYTVEIYGSAIDPKPYDAAPDLKVQDGLMGSKILTGNGTVTYKLDSSGEAQFYYVKITGNDGDRAWSAPIWVNYPEAGVVATNEMAAATENKYFWTKSTRSTKYHIKGCSAVSTISSKNLISGNTPPAGRTQHECNVEEEGH